MKKLSLKCAANGSHQVFDGDDLMGEIAGAHLKEYAATKLSSPNSISEIARVRSSPSPDELARVRSSQNPNATLVQMAERRERQRGISYQEALSEVAREFPELARLARARVLGIEA